MTSLALEFIGIYLDLIEGKLGLRASLFVWAWKILNIASE
jgi:hypothetical protein